MLRSLGAAALGACGGLIVGATQADHQALRIVTSLLTASNPAEPAVDPTDADSLVAASTRLADKAGGLCVLSTRSADGGTSSRMIQPLIETDDAGSPSLRFHTTARSTKFGELTADGRCTLAFLNPAQLTCIVFAGKAERLPDAEEQQLRDSWPLLPPLSILYPGDTLSSNFSGWRLRPSKVQLVALPAALGGGTREDWKAPEVERGKDGGWRVTCSGGI